MSRFSKILLIVAVFVTLTAVITWRATGGDYYTKFKVIKQVETEIDPDDPLANTGFYDDQKQIRTLEIDQFRMGLLPSAISPLDKNIISVASILPPLWVIVILMILVERRYRKKQKTERT